MKLIAVILILLAGVALETCSAVTVKEIEDSCKADCKTGPPYCFGYLQKDAKPDDQCNMEPSAAKCSGAFGSVTHVSGNSYKFQVVGKLEGAGADGWVGIAFVKQEADGQYIIGNSKGFACSTSSKDNIFMVESSESAVGAQFVVTNPNVKTELKATVGKNDAYLICEFEVDFSEQKFNVENQLVKIYLFGSKNKGLMVEMNAMPVDYMLYGSGPGHNIFYKLANQTKMTMVVDQTDTAVGTGSRLAIASIWIINITILLFSVNQL